MSIEEYLISIHPDWEFILSDDEKIESNGKEEGE